MFVSAPHPDQNLEPMEKLTPNFSRTTNHITQGCPYVVLRTPSVLCLQMTTLYESFLKGPEAIMTLTSDQDYPKILKDMMKHIHLEGDAVYKGYPFMENGV